MGGANTRLLAIEAAGEGVLADGEDAEELRARERKRGQRHAPQHAGSTSLRTERNAATVMAMKTRCIEWAYASTAACLRW